MRSCSLRNSRTPNGWGEPCPVARTGKEIDHDREVHAMPIMNEATSTSPGSSTPTKTMKAVAVLPGQVDSVHLAELPTPEVMDVPRGRGVLVKVLRVGVDGTDREINAAEYGAASGRLSTSWSSATRASATSRRWGRTVTELAPGDYVVATVRRPGSTHLRRDRHQRHDHRRYLLRARHQPASRLPDGVLRRRRRLHRQDSAGAQGGRRSCSSR